jgi:hypothetical protein
MSSKSLVGPGRDRAAVDRILRPRVAGRVGEPWLHPVARPGSATGCDERKALEGRRICSQRRNLRRRRREVGREQRRQIGRDLLEPGVRGRVRLRLIAIEAAGACVGDDGGDKADHQRGDEHQDHQGNEERDALFAPRSRPS